MVATVTVKLGWIQRVILSLLFAVSSVLASCLMLIAMTFELGLLFAVSLGVGAGKLVFTMLIQLPKLPPNYLWSAKGNYLPNPDSCCSKTDEITHLFNQNGA